MLNQHVPFEPEELLRDGWRERLKTAVPRGLDLDSERFAFFFGHVGDRGTARRKRFKSSVVDAGMVEGSQAAGSRIFALMPFRAVESSKKPKKNTRI